MSEHGRTMRTPLGRARGLGASRSGTSNFWIQRVTSVLSIPLVIAFFAVAFAAVGRDHAQAVQLLGLPLVAITMLLFSVVIIYHMWIGMQEIITDYVHDELKLLALMANTFFCLALGFASCFAVLKLALGM